MAKTDTRPAAFRQDVTLVVRVVVDGTMEEFGIDRAVMRSRIESYVIGLLSPKIGPWLKEAYAGRGPSQSDFFDPDRLTGSFAGDGMPAGLHVAFARLPVDAEAERAL